MLPTIITYQLNVANRTKLTAYYHNRIGLQVLTTSRHQTILGVVHALTNYRQPPAIKPRTPASPRRLLLPRRPTLVTPFCTTGYQDAPARRRQPRLQQASTCRIQRATGLNSTMINRAASGTSPRQRIVGITAELDGNHLIAHASYCPISGRHPPRPSAPVRWQPGR